MIEFPASGHFSKTNFTAIARFNSLESRRLLINLFSSFIGELFVESTSEISKKNTIIFKFYPFYLSNPSISCSISRSSSQFGERLLKSTIVFSIRRAPVQIHERLFRSTSAYSNPRSPVQIRDRLFNFTIARSISRLRSDCYILVLHGIFVWLDCLVFYKSFIFGSV